MNLEIRKSIITFITSAMFFGHYFAKNIYISFRKLNDYLLLLLFSISHKPCILLKRFLFTIGSELLDRTYNLGCYSNINLGNNI